MFHQERPAHRQVTPRQRGSLQRMRQAVRLRLYLFLLGFCAGAAPRKHNRRSRKLKSAAPVHHGMIPLIFAAGLIQEFRFVSTVTILQQGIHQPWWETA
jgi:hypothetical protein